MTPRNGRAARAKLFENMAIMYAERKPDFQISRALHCARQTVQRWRARNGLPRLYEPGCAATREAFVKVTVEQELEITRLLKNGWDRKRIRDKLGVSLHYVDKRRAKLDPRTPGLVPWGGQRRETVNATFRNDLYKRAFAAIPRGIAADLRDDMISDIVVAVLDGSLAEDRIEAEAGRFINGTYRAFASRFGPVSLDEARGEDGGWSLMQLVADPQSAAAMDMALYRGLYERGEPMRAAA